MKQKSDRAHDYVTDKDMTASNQVDFSPGNKVKETAKIPDRWHGSAKAMAKFIKLGLEEEALLLNCFMVNEIKKHSKNFQDYEKLYKNWSDTVNSYEA